MVQHNTQDMVAITKHLCVGPHQFAGAQALHAHLKTYAPPSAEGCWYFRSHMWSERGKWHIAISSRYRSNLIAASLSWSEPTGSL